MRVLRAVLLGVIVLRACVAGAQDGAAKPTDEELKKILADFDQYAAKSMSAWKIPGMAVGIVSDGKLVFAKGYGVKTLGGNDSVSENTIFQIGSTTKAFTATLAAILVDEGKLKWDDRVVDHAPGFMMYDPWVTREFQIVDLMSQRSGMPPYAADSLFAFGFDRPYIKHAIRHIKPVASFRSQYAYQNNLWLFAAEIIEKHGGKQWERILKERIFDPLKMTNSSADMQSFLDAKDVSSLHAASGDEVVALPRDWEFLDWSYVAGPAGSINSNIVDMAKWLAFQMGDGKVDGRQLVSEVNMKVLHSPKTVISPSGEAHKNAFYCLGWIYNEHAPYPCVWHNGGTLMKTMIAFVPEQKIGVVILSNLVTELPECLAFRLIDQCAGKPARDFSSEKLSEHMKLKEKERADKPVAPNNPVPPMPLSEYAGAYSNEVYGRIDVSIVDGKLSLVIGPRKVKAALTPWDKDIFTTHWNYPDPDLESSFAVFQADPQGKVTGLTLNCLNQDDDLGVFKREGKAGL